MIIASHWEFFFFSFVWGGFLLVKFCKRDRVPKKINSEVQIEEQYGSVGNLLAGKLLG